MTDLFRGDGPAGGLRAGLLALVVLGVVGTALALAFDRHWHTPLQLAPWVTLGVICVAAAALVLRQTAATIWLARGVAVLAILIAALGTWQHIDANRSGGQTHDGETTHAEEAAETETDSGHHHDDEETDSGHHHDDDTDATASGDDGSEDDAASAEHSLMDAMTGSAGSAPVPAALAVVPVGLALAFATIGLRGGRRPSPQ